MGKSRLKYDMRLLTMSKPDSAMRNTVIACLEPCFNSFHHTVDMKLQEIASAVSQPQNARHLGFQTHDKN